MNPEQQRIAIAEACGWEPIPEGYYHPDNPIGQTMPDYLNDLNAMHEAEKTLTVDQLIDQAERLGASSNEMPIKSWVVLLRATAAQRAEAFLRTIGKWEESK